MLAEKHPQSEERLATLYEYELLDTPAERDFDDITAFAARLCDVPVALVSLVDRDRQWFKSRVGMPDEQTDLQSSICSHAILSEGILEIPDLSADIRTRDNPLHVAGPGYQFYAGVPLVASNGLPLGTLCVLDNVPRTLTDFQREGLDVLARQVMTQIELRRQLRLEGELRAEINHRVSNSLQTIASLLRISTRSVNDDGARGTLQEVDRRLSAVAALHTELIGRETTETVQADRFMSRVVTALQDIAPSEVQISFSSGDIVLPARDATALGVIANEVVANALKHAFPDGRPGHVTLSLLETDSDGIIFTCADDGIGEASRDRTSDGRSVGSHLIEAAADQLGAHLSRDSDADGTRLRVTFDRPQLTA